MRKVEADAPHDVPSDIGIQLFRALFAGDVKTRFDECLGMVAAGRTVLRIQIKLNLDNPAVAPLAALPWELLHYHEKRTNLSKGPYTVVARYLDVPHSSDLPAFVGPLRVLFVMADPHKDLNLAEERLRIERRLSSADVQIVHEWMEGATFSTLESRLLKHAYHIVHFMGHGGFDGSDGVLHLERDTPGQGAIPIRGKDLAELLQSRNGALRLVVLNACRTAGSEYRPDTDPYCGVAPALVMAGVPAVVAMQFPISDDGAIDFAERLYSQLADGEPIEEAVRAGRLVLQREWLTPVLFSRCDALAFPRTSASALGPALGTPAHGVGIQVGDGRELLPYMVDRTHLMRELGAKLKRAGPAVPLVAIIHGDDAQCQDQLHTRICEIELPNVLGLDKRKVSLTKHYLEWPREYRGAREFHDHLTYTLAQRVQPGALPPAMQRAFAALPAPVVIQSRILSSQWHRYGTSVLDDYLAYWQAWPSDTAVQRLLVFIYIKYELPETGWRRMLAARRTEAVNAAVERQLEAVNRSDRDRVMVTVLPKLDGIDEQDVEDWRTGHDAPLAREDVRRMFSEHKATTSEERMSMEVAGKKLEALLRARSGALRVPHDVSLLCR
ncbi:MAG: CHAT domain-containing protein [Gemmatimonadetes bacterium]|nr:CHAT domain-containing protein [Gemmatimonadota bacterium]